MCIIRIHDAKKRLSARHEKEVYISQLCDIVNNFHEGENLTALCEKTLVEKIAGKILYKDTLYIHKEEIFFFFFSSFTSLTER